MVWPWYMTMDLVLCALAFSAVAWAWSKMNTHWRTSALLTVSAVMILQVLNELLSLHIFKAWAFSEAHSSLVGWEIWGAPIEEYLFWFSFAWMITFFYSGLASRENLKEGRHA